MAVDETAPAPLRAALEQPLLSATEELRLAERVGRGDHVAKGKMIESNLRLVCALARSYTGRGVPFADLVQEGTVGLARAVERFDHRRGLKFSTYAVWWIRRALLDAVAGAQPIRIPPKARRQLAMVGRMRAELARTGSPSDAAVALRSGLSETAVRRLRDSACVTASLDEPAPRDGVAVAERVADERAHDPLDSALLHERRAALRGMLRLLSPRQREVIVHRFGLHAGAALSHEEIGGILGVGEERSRQIEREALQRLRSIAPAFPLAA